MNVQTQNVRDIALSTYAEIYEKAHGDKMKTRVKAVNDACTIIVDNGGIPNARNVTEWIVSKRPAAHMPEQTIYNKRKGEISPYLKIIQAWSAVAASLTVSKPSVTKKGVVSPRGGEELMTDEDLLTISDIVVRHKVSILIGQYKGLRNQSEMRQAIKSNPPAPGILSVAKLEDAEDYNLALTPDEVEALTDFLNHSAASRRGIDVDEVGAVVVKRPQPGARISKPGFIDAIKKIVASYGPQLLK